MKWSFVIQQKLKAALLLTGVMALIVLSTLLSRSNIRGIDQSFSSIYQDRLVPAIDIVYLSENLYHKRLSLEKHLLAGETTGPATIKGQLHRCDVRIDSLLHVIETTHLVREESRSLDAFKNDLRAYARLEHNTLWLNEKGHREAGNALFDGRGAQTFQRAIGHLNELTNIQSVVGQKLMRQSHSEASQCDLLSGLLIGIAVGVGILILGLIHSAKITDHDPQPFHLN